MPHAGLYFALANLEGDPPSVVGSQGSFLTVVSFLLFFQKMPHADIELALATLEGDPPSVVLKKKIFLHVFL